MKKYILIIFSSLLVFASLPITALSAENTEPTNSKVGDYTTKDEVIYGNLTANGNIKNTYVVNSFHINESGEIVDYGKYSNVRNLTDLTNIERTGVDEVYFQAEGEEFYYQGELENHPLPWDISITYMLDGKEMHPKELAGKSGQLEIQIETSANKDVDPLFFEHYLLQISMTVDPSVFHDIQAPKGTEANEGKNKLITFSVMPGQEEVLILSANVTDLKMDPIDISAIPANIAIDDPDIGDMTDDMDSLSEAIREINDGVAELNSGISELNNGARELSHGSNEYRNGINELDQSSDELINGSQEILYALQQISTAMQESPDMPDFDDLENLPEGFHNLAKELKEFSKGLDDLNEVIQNIPDTQISDEQINNVRDVLEESNADASIIETVNQLERTYHAAQAVRKLNLGIPEYLAELTKNMATHIETIADGLESSLGNLGQLDDLVDLQNGLATLSSEYQTFHHGLVSYTDGVNTLATSYEELNTGTKDFAKGISALDEGVTELHDGTQKLYDSTSNLPDQVQSELDKFMEEYDFSNFEPASFVSNKNKNIGVVQFVLKTESIEVEDPEPATAEEEQEKSLWDRFLDLFR